MNDLQIFSFNDSQVRTVVIENDRSNVKIERILQICSIIGVPMAKLFPPKVSETLTKELRKGA